MPVTVSFRPKGAPPEVTPPAPIPLAATRAQAVGLQLISLRVKDAGSKTWRTVDVTQLSDAEKNGIVDQCSAIFKSISLESNQEQPVTLRFSKKAPERSNVGKVVKGWITNRPLETPPLELKTITYHHKGKIQTHKPAPEEAIKLHHTIGEIDRATQSIFNRESKKHGTVKEFASPLSSNP